MDPVALTLGPLQIRWYGIMAALGFLAAVFVLQKKRKVAGMTSGQISDLVTFTIISGIIGARIFYVIEFWKQFEGNLLEIIRIDHGGLVFYGGFICAVITIFVYCVRNKLSVVKVMDIAVPGLALGHAFGRLGCFINGCCYGKPTSMPWGYIYPPSVCHNHINPGVPLHPVQLYEAFGNLLIFAVLFYFAGRLKKGLNMSLYLIFYGFLRFCDEFFRGDHEDFFLGIFTPAQTIGLFIIPVGIIMLFYFIKRPDEANNT